MHGYTRKARKQQQTGKVQQVYCGLVKRASCGKSSC